MIDDDNLKRGLSAAFAVLIALASVGGAVSLGTTDYAPEVVQDASPVGESEAVAGTAAVFLGSAVAGYAIAEGAEELCERGIVCNSPSSDELAKADALETKMSIYQQAAAVEQSTANYLTSVNNSLNGMKTIARMEGKAAYIKALNNGSVEAVARSEAREAIAEYYTTRQQMLLKQWETVIYTGDAMAQTAKNTSNVSVNFARKLTYEFDSSGYYEQHIDDVGYRNTTVQLANGSSVDVPSLWVRAAFVTSTGGDYNYPEIDVTPASDSTKLVPDAVGNYGSYSVTGINVKPPNDNFNSLSYIDVSGWTTRWERLSQQNDAVQNNLDMFINQTYSAYQSGEINSSDLIDPYLGARNFSPEQNFDQWALRSGMALGLSPPENLDSIAHMTVEIGENEYQGLLMSRGLPDGQTFEVGETYNAANLTGGQYLFDMESGETIKIRGNFTVKSIETTDGESKSQLTYTDIEGQTTDLTAYKQKLEKLNEKMAEVNARQQRLREVLGGGGSGGGWPTLPGMGVWGTLAVLGGGLAAVGATTRIITP